MRAGTSEGRRIYQQHKDTWTVADALAFAEALVVDRYLEVKAVGIELMACYRKAFVPRLLPAWRRWLANDHSDNWATTDDPEDLIQKAVGWTLREAGKADPARLERYLRKHGPVIPRTTLRYAIERFPPAKRRELLQATRAK